MKSFNILLLGLIISLLPACTGNNSNQAQTDKAAAAATAPAKPNRPKIVKAPVTITTSDESDYPPILLEQGFPIHPRAEVANIGNAVLEGDGLFMRINVPDATKEIETYYDKEMAALGWTKGKLNIFKGANSALLYDKEGVVCKIIIIDESDYRKLAITLNRRKTIEELEAARGN